MPHRRPSSSPDEIWAELDALKKQLHQVQIMYRVMSHVIIIHRVMSHIHMPYATHNLGGAGCAHKTASSYIRCKWYIYIMIYIYHLHLIYDEAVLWAHPAPPRLCVAYGICIWDMTRCIIITWDMTLYMICTWWSCFLSASSSAHISSGLDDGLLCGMIYVRSIC